MQSFLAICLVGILWTFEFLKNLKALKLEDFFSITGNIAVLFVGGLCFYLLYKLFLGLLKSFNPGLPERFIARVAQGIVFSSLLLTYLSYEKIIQTGFLLLSAILFSSLLVASIIWLRKQSPDNLHDSELANYKSLALHSLPLLSFILALIIFFAPTFTKLQVISPNGFLYTWKPFIDHAPKKPRISYNGIASDFSDAFFPNYMVMYHGVTKNGEWPLTHNYNLSPGFNAATLFTSCLYSIDMGMMLLFGPGWGWTFGILLRFFLGGLFVYLLLREYKLERVAACFGAVVFSFSCFAVVNTLLPYLYSLPFLIYASELLIKRKRLVFCYFLLLANLAVFTCGQVVWAVHAFLLQGLYVLFRLLIDQSSWKSKGQVLLLFIATFIPTLLIVSFLILPSFEYLEYIALEYRNSRGLWHHSPFRLMMFLFPKIAGALNAPMTWGSNAVENAAYIGVIPFVLVLFAFIQKLPRIAYFYLFMGVFVFCVVTNAFSILSLLGQLPVFNSSSNTRMRFVWGVLLPIVSAFSLNHLLKSEVKRSKYIDIFWAITILITTSYFLSISDTKPYIIDYSDGKITKHITGQMLMLVVALFLIVLLRFVKYKKILASLLILIAFIDLSIHLRTYVQYVPPEYLFPKTKTTDYLRRHQEQESRFIPVNRNFISNFQIQYQLNTVQPRGFFTARQIEVIQLIDSEALAVHRTMAFYDARTLDLNAKVLDLLNVKHLLNKPGEKLPEGTRKDWKLVTRGELQIYENKSGYKPAFIVPSPKYVADPERIFEHLKSDRATKRALIEDPNWQFPRRVKKLKQKDVNLISASDNRMLYQTNSSDDAFIMFSLFYQPAWKVYIDGKQVPTTTANYVFLGANLPAGEHQIELRFEPKGYQLGIWLSRATILLLLLLLPLAMRADSNKRH